MQTTHLISCDKKYLKMHKTLFARTLIPIFMTLLSIFIADVSHHKPTIVRFSWLFIRTDAVCAPAAVRIGGKILLLFQFLEGSII